MSNNVFNNSYATTTILGQVNALHGILPLSYDTSDLMRATTINSKRSHHATEIPDVGEIPPLMGYFGIGINGYWNEGATPTTPLLQPYYPKATNMDLFTPIPFVHRLLSEDLTPTEKENYRMRTTYTNGGDVYVLYWLKKIEVSSSVVEFTEVNGSTQEETPYTISDVNLTPTPETSATPDVVPGNNTLKVGVEGICTVTGTEVIEVINGLYSGDLRKAQISEMGFYTGVDKELTHVDFGGSNVTYDEAIWCQLAAHRCFLPYNLSNPSGVIEERIKFQNASPIKLT